jgi:chemosensory pili system protein ChpA (sensor histidine kinase/response regulator)
MSSFSIEEVRDTIAADISSFLGKIEASAQALLSSAALAAAPLPRPSPFAEMGDHGHAIGGTCALVSAESLARSGRLLETLAEQGERELCAAEVHAARARRLAQLCADGATSMRSMLELELSHGAERALELADEWAARAALPDVDVAPAAAPEVRVTETARPGAPTSSEDREAFSFRDPASAAAWSSARTPASAPVPSEDREAFSFRDPASAAVAAPPEVAKVEELTLDLGWDEEAPPVPPKHTTQPYLGSPSGEAPETSGQAAAASASGLDAPTLTSSRGAAAPTSGLDAPTMTSSQSTAAPTSDPPETRPWGAHDLADVASKEGQAPLAGELALRTPEPGLAAIDAELLEAFRLEASVARAEMRDRLAALRTKGDGPSEDIGRILHSFKGAAGAVGFHAVGARAAEMQDRIERAAASGPLTADFVERFAHDTEAFFEACGLPSGHGPTSRPDSWTITPAPRSARRGGPLSSREPSPSSFRFGGEGEFSFSEDEPGGFDGELREAFRHEATESFVALEGYLGALLRDPNDEVSLQDVERLFHTLKGASATVGLLELSRKAEQIRRSVDDTLEGSRPINPGFVQDLVLRSEQLHKELGLPGVFDVSRSSRPAFAGPPSVGRGAAPRDRRDTTQNLQAAGARAFFESEARQILLEVGTIAAQLGGASVERRAEAQGILVTRLHRLKGSAMLVGEDAVAAEAARLQELCQRQAVPQAEMLQRGLEQIEKLLGAPSKSAASPAVAASGAVKRSDAGAGWKRVREAVQLPTDPELLDAFRSECAQLFDDLERSTLELEESVQPKQALEAVLRHFHTLKGVVFTMGLTPTGREIHLVEDFLDRLLAAAVLPPMRGVVSFLLEMQAEVRRHLKEAEKGYVEGSLGRVEARIEQLLSGRFAEAAPTGPDAHSSSALVGASSPSHGSAGSAAASGSGVTGSQDAPDRRFVRVATERLDGLMNLAGELVVSRARLVSRVDSLKLLQNQLGDSRRILFETVDRFREQHEFGLIDGGAAAGWAGGVGARDAGPARGRRAAALGLTSLPGGAALGPGQVALVEHAGDVGLASPWSSFGELELDHYDDVQILARRLAELGGDVSEVDGQILRELASFSDDSDAFAGIVSGIQAEVTRARMVPLEVVFTRLRLPVRDAAVREGKEARVLTVGEDVSVDKTIADALFQPMLHLVRNSVVHGIERPEQRAALGKSPAGSITLSARQESGQIVLSITDDGAGLDLAALHARGVAAGLIPADVSTSDAAVKDLVFAPGLSTRAAASDVSGRGVGCSVVRRAIARLNGDVRVDSAPGRGATFVVNLPVTLAITKALILRHRDRTYAIPLYFAERIVDLEEATVVTSGKERRFKLEDTYLLLRGLDDLLGLAPSGGVGGPIVVLRVGDRRTALQVDAVIGQEEVVIKSLGDVLTGHPLFAGVTIRGAGELTLILDVRGILEEGLVQPAAQAALRRSAAKPAAPRVDAPAEAPGRRAAKAAVPSPERKGPVRVLVVDDSISVRKVADKMLTALGAQVSVAVDGLDALQQLREATFDLVLTDLEMPRMHGYDLIRELKFLPQHADLPIIVVSSRSQEKHREHARALGAVDYITKPFSAQALDEALRRWGKRRVTGGDR